MAKFQAIRRIELAGLGEGWDKNCYIRFRTYSLDDFKTIRETIKKLEDYYAENKGKEIAVLPEEFIDRSNELHKGLFVDGKGYDGTELVDLEAEDVDEILALPGVRDLVQEVLVDTSRLKGLKKSGSSSSSSRGEATSTPTQS